MSQWRIELCFEKCFYSVTFSVVWVQLYYKNLFKFVFASDWIFCVKMDKTEFGLIAKIADVGENVIKISQGPQGKNEANRCRKRDVFWTTEINDGTSWLK